MWLGLNAWLHQPNNSLAAPETIKRLKLRLQVDCALNSLHAAFKCLLRISAGACTGWKMTGHEMASMVLHTGGGIPLVQPLMFNQEGGYYEATITAIEVKL